MINKALQSVVDALNDYLAERMGVEHPDPTPYVLLDNVAKLQQPALNNSHAHLFDNVLLTVVNLEKRTSVQRPIRMSNDPQPENLSGHYQLSLFCLFSVAVEPYSRALQFLGLITDYFHLHPVFEYGSDNNEDLPMKMTMEQQALSFEELKQVWAMLGGSQLPSVMFRANLQMSAAGAGVKDSWNSRFPYQL